MMERRRGRSRSDEVKQRGIASYFRSSSRIAARESSGNTTLTLARNFGNFGEEAGTLEENILALLDMQGVKDEDDIEDDKLSFLDAVKEIFLASADAKAPSKKVHKAVFMCLQESSSLEVAFASHGLLMDLDKAFPRVSLNQDVITIDNQIWSPLGSSVEDAQAAAPQECVDIPAFTQKLAERWAAEVEKGQFSHMLVARMLTLDYLVSLWHRDYTCRKGDVSRVESSLINQHLKKLSKKLFADFLESLLELSQLPTGSLDRAITSTVAQSINVIVDMIIELSCFLEDTHSGGIPGMEVILNSSEDQFMAFLQIIQNPHQRLELARRFLLSRLPKSNGVDYSGPILATMLECLSSEKKVQRVRKSMGEQTLQSLLVHLFVALCESQEKGEAAIARVSTSFLALTRRLFPEDVGLHPTLKQALIVAKASS